MADQSGVVSWSIKTLGELPELFVNWTLLFWMVVKFVFGKIADTMTTITDVATTTIAVMATDVGLTATTRVNSLSVTYLSKRRGRS